MERHFPPSKLPPSNAWFLGPTRILNPNGISIGAAVFAGITSVTDRPTDHATVATRLVTISRVYVRSTAMRPKKLGLYGMTTGELTLCLGIQIPAEHNVYQSLPFLHRVPFLPLPSQFTLAWDRHQIC